MWDGLFILLSLSLVMAVASFLAGSLPLSFTLSQRQLRLLSAVGTGVLVGTALIVIIPEGIETLYEAGGKGHGHGVRAAQQLPIKPAYGLALTSSITSTVKPTRTPIFVSDFWRLGPQPTTMARYERAEPEKDTTSPANSGATHEDEHQGDEHEHEREPHAWVGVSLVTGFILMYLIDQVPKIASSGPKESGRFHVSLSDLGRGLYRSASTVDNDAAIEAAQTAGHTHGGTGPPNTPSTTIGLVIHAAADGIALGASSSTSNTRLGFLIFIAIMIHKAPAAFGLTTVLLKQGLSKRTARTHLLIFSLAAPVGALLTWVLVNMMGKSWLGGEDGMSFATGVLLLFSGGTFLYVAMHTMQDSHSHQEPPTVNGYAEESYGRIQQDTAPKASEVGAAVLGMLLPLLTQFGYAH